MASVNSVTQRVKIYTHEGAPGKYIGAVDQLRRSVLSCMLWEDEFYEDGQSIADRISQHVQSLLATGDHLNILNMAIEARSKYKLRHAPLWIMRALAKNSEFKFHEQLTEIIQRPDEITEFLALYWKDGKQPISNQVKKGLANAFNKFDEYQLAKYDRDGKVRLRDALFLCHAKPKDEAQAGIFKRLVDGNLKTPDTWETNLSAGKDKKETWTRLLGERKMGAMAILRNLRNMIQAGVDKNLIKDAIVNIKATRILPFRFVTAAEHALEFEPQLETAMFKCLSEMPKIGGKTVLLIDVSYSMVVDKISKRSEMDRLDAACALAMLAREICEDVQVFSFSDRCVQVPPRRGFALRDAIINSQPKSYTYLGKAVDTINSNLPYDRLIVLTDEQANDRVPDPKDNCGYMINVGSYQNGVGYKSWKHIDGWSEAVINWIIAYEKAKISS